MFQEPSNGAERVSAEDKINGYIKDCEVIAEKAADALLEYDDLKDKGGSEDQRISLLRESLVVAMTAPDSASTTMEMLSDGTGSIEAERVLDRLQDPFMRVARNQRFVMEQLMTRISSELSAMPEIRELIEKAELSTEESIKVANMLLFNRDKPEASFLSVEGLSTAGIAVTSTALSGLGVYYLASSLTFSGISFVAASVAGYFVGNKTYKKIEKLISGLRSPNASEKKMIELVENLRAGIEKGLERFGVSELSERDRQDIEGQKLNLFNDVFTSVCD